MYSVLLFMVSLYITDSIAFLSFYSTPCTLQLLCLFLLSLFSVFNGSWCELALQVNQRPGYEWIRGCWQTNRPDHTGFAWRLLLPWLQGIGPWLAGSFWVGKASRLEGIPAFNSFPFRWIHPLFRFSILGWLEQSFQLFPEFCDFSYAFHEWFCQSLYSPKLWFDLVWVLDLLVYGCMDEWMSEILDDTGTWWWVFCVDDCTVNQLQFGILRFWLDNSNRTCYLSLLCP